MPHPLLQLRYECQKESNSHGVSNFIIADSDYVIDVLVYDLDRIIIGRSTSHTIGNQSCHRRLDCATGLVRKCVRWRTFSNSYDPGFQLHAIAYGASGANTRSHSNRNIDGVEIRNGSEQLHPVSRDPGDDVAMKSAG